MYPRVIVHASEDMSCGLCASRPRMGRPWIGTRASQNLVQPRRYTCLPPARASSCVAMGTPLTVSFTARGSLQGCSGGWDSPRPFSSQPSTMLSLVSPIAMEHWPTKMQMCSARLALTVHSPEGSMLTLQRRRNLSVRSGPFPVGSGRRAPTRQVESGGPGFFSPA